nr:transmembrane inner ear expressed protein isoform X2 [Manis javanica]
MGAGGPGTRHRGRISDAHSHAACDQIATAEGRRAWASPRANPASGIAPFPGPAAEPSVTMAQHWRGAEPRWSLGGAVLGVCLAGVAGQLVEEHLFSQLIKGNCIGVIFLPSTYSLSKGLAEPGGSREAPERWPWLESMVPTHSSPAAIILHHVVGSDGGWGLHASEFRSPGDTKLVALYPRPLWG